MFRIVRKLPVRAQLLNSYKLETKTLSIRNASKQGKEDLCPPKEIKNSSGAAYTFGVLALAAGATIGYAKYDEDFRKLISSYVPQFNDFMAIIFFENESEKPDPSAGQPGGQKLIRSTKSIPEKPINYNAPAPVFDKVAEETKTPLEYTEIRVAEKLPDNDEIVMETLPSGERREGEKSTVEIIAELEAKMADDTNIAVNAFNKSVYALKNYNYDIEVVVEESVENIHPDVWSGLKEKTIEKNEAIEEAEKHSQEALCTISKLKDLLRQVADDVPETLIERTKENMSRIQEDLCKARKDMDVEIQRSKLSEKYWQKVEEARSHFSKELEALFPNINFKEKDVSISSTDMDLFVLHAMSKVLYFQKELNRLDTLGNKRLKDAIEEAKKTGSAEPLTREQICQQLEKEKRALEMQYNRKCLQLRQQSESELRQKLKLQSEAFTDHLDDAIKTREMEMERALNRRFDEQMQIERSKYKMQVSAMVGRLRGMEQALKARSDADQTAKKAQILWSACQTLIKAVQSSALCKPRKEHIRPIDAEIKAVKKASNENDELINAVIEAIPEEAISRGVFPEDVLKERFIIVEKVAKSVALLPETGGRLHLYFLSYLQSLLLMNASNPIPTAELNDEKCDFTKLTNNDVLQRARYWLDRGDFAQALRYMNLLKGAPRTIALQWMDEARILLETQQAAKTLMAYATSSGLIYL